MKRCSCCCLEREGFRSTAEDRAQTDRDPALKFLRTTVRCPRCTTYRVGRVGSKRQARYVSLVCVCCILHRRGIIVSWVSCLTLYLLRGGAPPPYELSMEFQTFLWEVLNCYSIRTTIQRRSAGETEKREKAALLSLLLLVVEVVAAVLGTARRR